MQKWLVKLACLLPLYVSSVCFAGDDCQNIQSLLLDFHKEVRDFSKTRNLHSQQERFALFIGVSALYSYFMDEAFQISIQGAGKVPVCALDFTVPTLRGSVELREASKDLFPEYILAAIERTFERDVDFIQPMRELRTSALELARETISDSMKNGEIYAHKAAYQNIERHIFKFANAHLRKLLEKNHSLAMGLWQFSIEENPTRSPVAWSTFRKEHFRHSKAMYMPSLNPIFSIVEASILERRFLNFLIGWMREGNVLNSLNRDLTRYIFDVLTETLRLA